MTVRSREGEVVGFTTSGGSKPKGPKRASMSSELTDGWFALLLNGRGGAALDLEQLYESVSSC